MSGVQPQIVSTLPEMLAAANAQGRFTLEAPAWMRAELSRVRSSQEAARRLLEGAFIGGGFPLADLAFTGTSVRTWERDYGLIVRRDSLGNWAVSMDLASVLHLRGDAPAAQKLASLGALMDFLREQMLTRPGRIFFFRIFNERDRRGRVDGRISAKFMLQAPGNAQEEAIIAEAARLKLEELGMQDWLRQVALALGRVGRHSWLNLTAKALFTESEIMQKLMESKAAAADAADPQPQRARERERG